MDVNADASAARRVGDEFTGLIGFDMAIETIVLR
jgi:hypothetical protein